MKRIGKVLSVIMLCAAMLFLAACGKEKEKFTHGSVGASSYSNSFLGLSVSLDSDWTITTDSELASLNGLSDMSAANVEASFEKNGTIQEMMAAKEDGTSMNIVVQDTTKTGSLTEDGYFTTGLELLKTQLEATGAKANVKAADVTFLGTSTRAIDVEMSMSGVTVYMYQVPIFKGDYITSITVGSLTKADLDSLLAMFKAA